MIVTIDGPAGAGKSSVARALAQRLGFRFLDTGSMYRAVTLAAVQAGIDWQDRGALEKMAQSVAIEVGDDQVWLNGEEVTQEIRTFAITTATRYLADLPVVRDRLIELQRQAAAGHDVVTEGRDQGTVAFPDAECKIFLTASEEVRARRRFDDLCQRGEEVGYEEVLEKQRLRDQRDIEREIGGLTKAADAIEVVTDGLRPEEVVEQLLALVEARRVGDC